MTPPPSQTGPERHASSTPSTPSPAQQRAAEQKAAAKIDAAEFWRRLGL